MGFDVSEIVETITIERATVGGREMIANLFLDKRVAVDVSGWIFEARSFGRMRGFVRANKWNDFAGAWKTSAVKIVQDRVCALRSLRATPIIVVEPEHRDGKRGRAKAPSSAGLWAGIVRDIEKECAESGTMSVRAPGEGEEECARMNCVGEADMVWSADVGDALL
jgi:hypothetical protein